MRYFLGFDLEAKTKLSVQSWREKALPYFDHLVPPANFHVTCVFLGQIQEHQLEQLCLQIDKAEFAPFSITFDTLGYWSKPKILWLGSHQASPQASKLAETLTGFARSAISPSRNEAMFPILR